MEIQIKKANNNFILNFSGDLKIKDIKEQITVLKQYLKAEKLQLNLENVKEIDLENIQIFCSACKSMAKSKRKLEFTGKTPENFKQLLEDAGFTKDNCLISKSNSKCLYDGIQI